MKKGFYIFLLFTSTAGAEIWDRPDYVPDENHLPGAKIQEHEDQRHVSESRGEGYWERKKKESGIQKKSSQRPKTKSKSL